MAHSLSAKKRIRQNIKAKARNRAPRDGSIIGAPGGNLIGIEVSVQQLTVAHTPVRPRR